MKLIKEISYTDVMQRKAVYVNSFLSFCIFSALFFDSAHFMFSIDIYGSSFKQLFLTSSAALLLGNLAGLFLFRRMATRSIFISVEIAFILISALFLARDLLNRISQNILPDVFLAHSELIPAILAILPFILGIKSNYFLKIACGNFIDDKKGAVPFIVSVMAGAAAGAGLFSLLSIFREFAYISALIPMMLLPTIFIIKLLYSLPPQYTQETNDTADITQDESTHRDDIYFTFLNYSCILVYILLGYKIIEKQYGNLFHIHAIFILITIVAMMLGFIISRIVKNAFWFIYSEMLFPISFLVFLWAVFINDYDRIIYIKILYFSIPAAVFGFSFYKSMEIIMTHYDHEKRFNILNYSLFVLPIPILIAVSIIEFTSLLFFIFLYIIMLVNVLLPGIHLLQSSIQSYKKIVYFILSLVFIPSIYVFHRYLGIPFNNELFVNHVSGFQLLYNNKYNSLYIQNNSNVLSHGNVLFINNDGAIRNLRKIIIPLKLFAGDEKSELEILFIDGNQKFFRNDSIALFNKFRVLDYLPERYVDNNILPLTGNQKYMVDKNRLIRLINKNEEYHIIVDIPNVFDQKYYEFRFNEEYYKRLKNNLKADGIFAQVFNLNNVKKSYIDYARISFNKLYKKVIGYQCADTLMILGSDTLNRFDIKENNYKLIAELFNKSSEMLFLFFNEEHLLSHFQFSEIFKYKNVQPNRKKNIFNDYLFNERMMLSESIRKSYIESGSEFISLVPDDAGNANFKRKISFEVARNGDLFSMLKASELAGVERDFEKEAEILSLVEKKYNYRDDLRKYIEKIFSMKKEFYFNTAIELEKEKKWEDAKKLYSAILKIDNTHFDANYRMGLLYITLQNMNDAFAYMQQAMKLKNDDPRVQYQMGVLLFSGGKAQEALKYLDRAVELKQDSASLYMYIGFCHEELGKFPEAKNYYQKAILKDPNDSNIKLSLDRINSKIQEEVDKWKTKDPENQNEAEQGENIPLPINKSAYDWRITDQEAKRLKGAQ